MAEPEVVPPLAKGVPEFQQAGKDTASVVPTESFLPYRLPRVFREDAVVLEGCDEVIRRRAGMPPGGVIIYLRGPVMWGASASHRHPSAALRWRRASRVPSATTSHPTRSPLQLSRSRRSAAARLVGSMKSRGPGMSLSRDRASSYVGPPSLNCATASRVAPSSGGSHQMVAASHPPVCISWLRARWRRGARGGGGGAPG